MLEKRPPTSYVIIRNCICVLGSRSGITVEQLMLAVLKQQKLLQQKTKPSKTSRKKDTLNETPERRERLFHPQWREDPSTDCDFKKQNYRQRLDGEFPYMADCSCQQWSAPQGPTQRTRVLRGFAFVGVFLVLGALLGVFPKCI